MRPADRVIIALIGGNAELFAEMCHAAEPSAVQRVNLQTHLEARHLQPLTGVEPITPQALAAEFAHWYTSNRNHARKLILLIAREDQAQVLHDAGCHVILCPPDAPLRLSEPLRARVMPQGRHDLQVLAPATVELAMHYTSQNRAREFDPLEVVEL